MFVPVLEQGMVYFTSVSSLPEAMGGRRFYTAVRALDASTGRRVWEYRRGPRLEHQHRMGGPLSPKGDNVFGGDQTNFFSLASPPRPPPWSVQTGGPIH